MRIGVAIVALAATGCGGDSGGWRYRDLTEYWSSPPLLVPSKDGWIVNDGATPSPESVPECADYVSPDATGSALSPEGCRIACTERVVESCKVAPICREPGSISGTWEVGEYISCSYQTH